MTAVEQPVTRADIEAKLRQIKGEVDSGAETAKSYAPLVGIAGAILLLGLAYFLGRRKGRKKTTFVQISRL